MTLIDIAPPHIGAPQPLADIAGLRVSFPEGSARNRRTVVDNVSFRLDRGRCVALVGESGSGKSVIGRSLLGLNPRSAQTQATTLQIDGGDFRSASPAQWRSVRGSTIGLVLQDAMVSLDPLRTIEQEILEALHRGRPTAANRAEVDDLLRSVGIDDPELRRRQHAHELSGGLRQRALIATALAGDPAIIVADEPTTALDVTVQAQVIELLRSRVTEGSRSALLLISHDLAVVSDIADHVLVLKQGTVVEEGSTAQVLGDPSHPYTQALVRAIPRRRSRGFYLAPVHSTISTPAQQLVIEDRPALTPLPTRTVDHNDLVLEVDEISKSYRTGHSGSRFVAVDSVSFTLARGETLGIVGESGSGKSTVAKIVLGLEAPDTGSVSLAGRDWSSLPERQRRSHRHLVGLIPQDPLSSFDPRWHVERIISESLIERGATRSEHHERVRYLLNRVGLDDTLLGRRPSTLSGGQRQRVAIARALAPEPSLLVCDEPTSALDVSVQAQVLDLICEIQAELQTSLLFVSHDLRVIEHVSDTVLILKDGRTQEFGPAESVLSSPVSRFGQQLVAAVPEPPETPTDRGARRVPTTMEGHS